MSGFFVLSQAKRTTEPKLVSQLAGILRPSSPDGVHCETLENVILGYGHLVTTYESRFDDRPVSLDGNLWMTGDIRLDRRDELIRELENSDYPARPHDGDAALLLRAYKAWGEDCLNHISGDFAFAIWNVRDQSLFAARDHFGLVPCYYARIGSEILISTHIQLVKRHPDVNVGLNDQMITDFLLFSQNMQLDTTAYSGIQKLPPGHKLNWSDGELNTAKYWSPPDGGELICYRDPRDYPAHYLEIFKRSVGDRLRADRAGTHLSGGLDSTSIASVATGYLPDPSKLQAYNIYYGELLPDEREGDFATLMAQHLGTPLEQYLADDYLQKKLSANPKYVPAEPGFIPESTPEYLINVKESQQSRTLFAGFGGDPLFYPTDRFWQRHRRQMGWNSTLSELWSFYRRTGNIPPIGARTLIRKMRGKSRVIPFPTHINSDLIKLLALEDRFDHIMGQYGSVQNDHAGMAWQPLWSNIFAHSHAGYMQHPIRLRFPFFDLQLMEFVNSIPNMPWLFDKHLLREAFRGILPESIRTRPKTSLPGFAISNATEKNKLPLWMVDYLQKDGIQSYVDTKLMLDQISLGIRIDPMMVRSIMSTAQLSYWLEHHS